MKFTPRPYQQVAIDHAYEFLCNAAPGAKQLYAAPTGVGKSIIEEKVKEKLPDCWLVTPRVEIVLDMLRKIGKPKDNPDLHRISTPIKLRNRLASGSIKYPKQLIFDESHHHEADTWQQIDLFTGNVPSIGYTATPYRGTPKSTKAFLEAWGEPLWIISYQEAVEEGYISMPEFHMLPLVDDDEVVIRNGEFDVTSLDGLTVDRLGDVANHSLQWYKNGKWDRATIFAFPSGKLCKDFQKEMTGRGLPTIIVDADTPSETRQQAFKLCEEGVIALAHVDIVSEGVDLRLRRFVDLAPTLSPVKWVQKLGRITRAVKEGELPPEYICIAEGTPVMTGRGWVPIEQVKDSDLVWDGRNWVHHDGVVCNGIHETIDVCGVRMTPTHKVLTEKGMIPGCEVDELPMLGRYSDSGRLLLSDTRKASANAPVAMNTKSTMEISSLRNQDVVESVTLTQLSEVNGKTVDDTHGQKSIPCVYGHSSPMQLQDVQTQHTDSMNTTVEGESRSSSPLNLNLLNTCSPSRIATMNRESLTESRMRDITKEGIYDSPLSQSQVRTLEEGEYLRRRDYQDISENLDSQNDSFSYGNLDEPTRKSDPSIAVTGQQSVTRLRVYDIVNCGPNHRFQAGKLIVANCTNRNIMRHAYALEGAIPVSELAKADKAFSPPKRAHSRVLGLEAIGRFRPATVSLTNGLTAHVYSLSTVVDSVMTQYCVVVPAVGEPIWGEKKNIVKDGKITYGKWEVCIPPEDVKGFSSVVPGELSEKQLNWWNRSAPYMGLIVDQEINRKNFQILPFLSDIGARLT